MARDIRFFKKHGLDAQVLYVQGGGVLIQAMLNGNIPISITSGSQAIVSNLAGNYLQKPYPSVKGIHFTLQDLDRTKPGTAELSPLRFADMELVKELETNGFIERVYGKK